MAVKDGLKNSLGSDFVRLDRRVCRLKKWKLNFRWERKLYQNRSWADGKQAWITGKDRQLFRLEKIAVGRRFCGDVFRCRSIWAEAVGRDRFHCEFISFGVECVPEEIMAAWADTVLAYFCRAGRAFHFQGGIARPGLFAGAALNGHGCEI